MEEEVKNNYVLGVIGALIGALIGAIPWILCYIFANMIYAILSIVIVLGGFYGYKLTKAKIDKKLPVILSITSFISITMTMFIFIPLAWMAKEEIPISMDNFILMYQYDEFTGAIIGDYIISLLFCILVISGIIYNLNKQIKQGVDSKDIKILTQDASNDAFSKEDIEKIKNIFEKNDIRYQIAELGKVDVGGGGTIAYILANKGVDVIDCGVPVLSMHAPYEVTSKFDLYEAYRGYKAFWME